MKTVVGVFRAPAVGTLTSADREETGTKKEPGGVTPGLAGIPEWDTGILSGGLHRGGEESSSPLLGGRVATTWLAGRPLQPVRRFETPAATASLTRPASSFGPGRPSGATGVVDPLTVRGSSGPGGIAIILFVASVPAGLPVPQLPTVLRRPGGLPDRDVAAAHRHVLADVPPDPRRDVGRPSSPSPGRGRASCSDPIAGAFADRVDRRRILIVAQALSVVPAAVLGILTIARLVAPWHVVVLAFFDRRGALVRDPDPAGLHPRHRGARGPGQRHRHELGALQRRAPGRARDRRCADPVRRRGLVLHRQRGLLSRDPVRAGRDAAAPSGGAPHRHHVGVRGHPRGPRPRAA